MHKYLSIQIKVWPDEPDTAEYIKKLIEEGTTNLLGKDSILFEGNKRLGKVVEVKASTWPKPCM